MIQRAAQFSPNSVEKDMAILDAVGERLRRMGAEVSTFSEDSLDASFPADTILTMGRRPATLAWLKSLTGVRIINAPEGIGNCSRYRLQTIMRETGVSQPPEEGAFGYWLKRGDAAAQSQGDVVYAADRASLQQAIAAMQQRGISQYVVSAHVPGDLIKFYGVRGTGFFRYYYPTDDGQTKFDDERRNGTASHYPFDVADMQRRMEQLAEAVGVHVYGGDCIVRSDGSWCCIDFNDWPSFSRCREEAADAIASLIKD